MLDHGFPPDTWLAYLDGTLPESQRDELLAHTRQCTSCAEMLAGFSNWQTLLELEGAQSRERLRLADERVQRLTARVLANIHAPEASAPATTEGLIREGLDTLRAVLVPMCGLHATETTLETAAARSSALNLGRVSIPNWSEFIASLSAVVASYCGLTPARLVAAAAPRLGELSLT